LPSTARDPRLTRRSWQRLVAELPPHNAWVEAFCGSAALTLAKQPAPIEVINDLNAEITNLFRQLRKNSTELCKSVALTPYAAAEFARAHDGKRRGTALERARQFLVRTMMTVNGTVDGSRTGFSFSQSYTRDGKEARVNRWFNLPDRLATIVDRLRHVRIEQRDAREIVKMFSDRPATLVYLDPPYFTKRLHGYGKDAEAAMALSLGKPVIFYCDQEQRGRFYRDVHPLSRLIEFETGIAVGAMVTDMIPDVVELIFRILENRMQYELEQSKPGFLRLKERLTGSVLRLQTNDPLLTETFWNHYHKDRDRRRAGVGGA
jgi:site-specific DNA-adenine methylase